ncbi:G-patch domain - like 6 [Theobroma cacao]|nr:G-patch domain - like 6 [Theobroma cacao]
MVGSGTPWPNSVTRKRRSGTVVARSVHMKFGFDAEYSFLLLRNPAQFSTSKTIEKKKDRRERADSLILLVSRRKVMGEAVGSSGSTTAIGSSNIGFQLLKKHGWREGTGLGISEQV